MDPAFQQLGLAVLLGLLVGLQREHAASGLAGMRTFPLITVLGVVSALLAKEFGGWIVAAGLLGIAVLIGVHAPRVRPRETMPGTTTDVTMLLMFGVGALLVIGPTAAAVAIGGAAAVLLQFKPELHRFAQRLGDEDLKAIMQFVLITFIILPLLPNHSLALLPDPPYGPLNILNPFEVWLMVVLIVGLSLSGYVFYKFLGQDAGILFGGVLGGAISSTATTVSYSRQARGDRAAAISVAVVIMIASTISFLRVLTAVAVVAPTFVLRVAPPVLLLMLLTLLPSLLLWLWQRRLNGGMPPQENPTQLKSAIVFGIMYAAVLLGLAAAKFYLQSGGLYIVAGLSGLTEMDAITLSVARLSQSDPQVATDGWRLIVVAAMANMVSKACLAGLLGGLRIFLQVSGLFLISLAGGGLLLALL